MITLFHYIHCPFCIRVRMALGALEIKFSSQPLPYEDEQTPVKLCDKKMLPILQNDKMAMNESLEIISYLDQSLDSSLKNKNQLGLDKLENQEKLSQLEDLLSRLGKPIHNLCMPYWAYSKEFTQASRDYFIQKKSQKRGPFSKLIQNKEVHLKELAPLLDELEEAIGEFYNHEESFSIFDIMIASHIWGLYVFPEFQFSSKIHAYLQKVKGICNFEYHEDFWRD